MKELSFDTIKRLNRLLEYLEQTLETYNTLHESSSNEDVIGIDIINTSTPDLEIRRVEGIEDSQDMDTLLNAMMCFLLKQTDKIRQEVKEIGFKIACNDKGYYLIPNEGQTRQDN